METFDEEVFAATPYKTVDLPLSCPRGTAGGGVAGARDADGVVEVREVEGAVVRDGVDVSILGVKVLLDLELCWRPCNSFSANIARWNKVWIERYSL